ncbi:MAG: alpha/beta hydrolase [Deltaproteobacteria bacterium]|nr:MAG: alpha/beta hydrolase [Deltaproteobacteria bacterium]
MSVMSMLSLAERAQVPPIMGEHRTTGSLARSKRALGACPRSLEFHVVPCRDSQERRRDRAIRSQRACTTRRVTTFSRSKKEDFMLRLPLPCSLLTVTAALATGLAIGCGADPSQEPQRAPSTEVSAIRNIDKAPIRTIDHYVHHVSTVDANYGKQVKLFVREKVRRDLQVDRDIDGDDDVERSRGRKGRLPVVLMIAGATQPSVSIYDIPFKDYSWMTYLAQAGFDVFAMDLTGYGFSPRPAMDDPCNASIVQQLALLIPNPLAYTCPPSYAFKMAIQSDWDEMDTVVDYLRESRGVDRVSLIGWSRGGPRIGGYTARHGEKVEKLVLYSPAVYDRDRTSSEPPRDPVTHRLIPQPGILMQVQNVKGLLANWDTNWQDKDGKPAIPEECDPFEPAIREVLGSTSVASDALGSTWGSDGVFRAPAQNTLWGWNATDAGKITAPTLIIRGLRDVQAPEPPQRLLFADLKAVQKVFVRVSVDTNGVIHHDP